MGFAVPHYADDDDEAQAVDPESAYAQVGHTDDGLVALFLPSIDRTILLSTDRAREFAALLLKHADLSDIKTLRMAQERRH